MPTRALTADEVAGELGRSRDWLYRNWESLVAGGMPRPLLDGDGLLSWSAPHLYAWLDRDLPDDMKATAAAFRAALEAARAPAAPLHMDEVAAATARLDQRFAKGRF